MLQDKYIGLVLAITSTLAIGTSFVITKKGLLEASKRHGFEGDGFAYLKSPMWWGGIVTMVIGEAANFSAYAFAPAILVTPLGALSVLIGAVLGAYFLNEELGILGKLGCAMCLVGSVIIVLHAPADKDIQTVDEILHYALYPGRRFHFFSEIHSNQYLHRRIPTLLFSRCCVLEHYDIPSRSKTWQKQPAYIYLHMFHSWIRLNHVNEGLWYCAKVDYCWK